jgi:hypothetical protein
MLMATRKCEKDHIIDSSPRKEGCGEEKTKRMKRGGGDGGGEGARTKAKAKKKTAEHQAREESERCGRCDAHLVRAVSAKARRRGRQRQRKATAPEVVHLGRGPGACTTIGRQAGAVDVVMDSAGAAARMISRRHATVECRTAGVWIVADTRSLNGVFVNDVKTLCAPLADGDVVTFGGAGTLPEGERYLQPDSDFRYVFRCSAAAAAATTGHEGNDLFRNAMASDSGSSGAPRSPAKPQGPTTKRQKVVATATTTVAATTAPTGATQLHKKDDDSDDDDVGNGDEEDHYQVKLARLRRELEETNSAIAEIHRQRHSTDLSFHERVAQIASQAAVECASSQERPMAAVATAVGATDIEEQRQQLRIEAELMRKEFVSSLSEEFVCSICQELLIEPRTIACGHSFCEKCLCSWTRHRNVCPVCREPIIGRPIVALALANILLRTVDRLPEDERREYAQRRAALEHAE